MAPTPPAGPASERVAWVNVALASILMVATLPGRTQGLGLVTEGILRDSRIDRVLYSNLNLWATLLGAAFCLPAGRWFDRFGLRWTTALILLLLGAAVWAMSVSAGGFFFLFILILLTRGLGQSALSVSSITLAGKSSGGNSGLAMGVYSVFLSLLFAGAFVVVGGVVRDQGWRAAWADVAWALILGALPLTLLLLREPKSAVASGVVLVEGGPAGGLDLRAALREPAFWVFAGATSLYGLVASGLGLFNESIFAERGFGQSTYHTFLGVTTLIALVGQLACGGLSLRMSMSRLLAVAMALYGAGLAFLPLVTTLPQLWIVAGMAGLSGGMITVVFFAIWSHAFGKAHLGRIQGAAQMLTVLASAVGPLLFAKCRASFGSYTPAFWTLAPVVLVMGAAAWRVPLPELAGRDSSSLTPAVE